MKLKSKLIFSYVVALVMSHLWIAFVTEDSGGFIGKERAESKANLVILFPKMGGLESELEKWGVEVEEGGVADVWIQEGKGEELDSAIVSSAYESIYLVGEGYGSVEALSVAAAHSERIKGVVLFSPKLSTRFELLGDERLNRALKAFQLAWFWVLENAVPHFGLSQKLPYHLGVAKQVYDAEQEESERLFEELDTPVLLVYEENGDLVEDGSLEAYKAVRPRLLELLYSGSEHDFLEEAGVGLFSTFKSRIEVARRGSGREELTPRFGDFPGVSLGAWWGGALLAIATFASEDFACIGGGLLAASGSVSLTTAVVGCLLGIFLGDLGIYFIGRVFGAAALDLPVVRGLVSPKALGRSSEWFDKHGIGLVVLTRFFPGSRVPTYFAAGVVKVSWIRFAFALLVASAVWTPILVFASYFLGDRFLRFFESMGAGGWLGIVAFIVCFAIGVRVFAKVATWRGRRLLFSRWRRMTSWEFWPMWAVYLPVVFQIGWLAFRYRSVSLPFSVNPCMPASGLVYESKIQILEHLEKAGVPVARFEAIGLDLSLEEKLARLKGFMERLGLSYPVVLKPDVGQRGQGVEIAGSVEDARLFFDSQEEDTIAQEYIGGSEYGVFYHRFANRETGEISSITDKRTTSVVGDGEATLEQLILRDERAVCMAGYFLNEYESQLERVLEKGERFLLASIGTHSRGAIFLDGAELLTDALSNAVDSFSRVVPGFHFGRYDLRVPSEEHLRRGEGIRVIELNGITSEPTNMYDPKHGPLFGWRALMRQWRLIFALAKENRLAGHEAVSKRYVLRLAMGHFRGVPSRDLS